MECVNSVENPSQVTERNPNRVPPGTTLEKVITEYGSRHSVIWVPIGEFERLLWEVKPIKI